MALTPVQNPSPFFNRAEEYVRDIDPIRDYVQTQALYLSRRYGKPFEECVEFVKKTISKSGAHPVRDPEIKFLGKNEVGDLEPQRGTLMGYLNEEVRAGAIIAPTMTSYIPEKVLPSKLLKKIGSSRLVTAYKALDQRNEHLVTIQIVKEKIKKIPLPLQLQYKREVEAVAKIHR